MPISDQDGYENGHFSRVYQHLIKPACEKAGFTPIRADDEVKTNHIVIDIIRKILESDLVLADLSAKNPNVMYELGIRQAFNKKTVLIKDNKTSRVFDIQGLRTIDYDENLRIDEVQKVINKISNTLSETYKSGDEEINSLLQLLSLTPASYPEKVEISKESNLVLGALDEISSRLSKIENGKSSKKITEPTKYKINGYDFKVGDEMYDSENGHKTIGKFLWLDDSTIFYVEDKTDEVKSIHKTDSLYKRIDLLPF